MLHSTAGETMRTKTIYACLIFTAFAAAACGGGGGDSTGPSNTDKTPSTYAGTFADSKSSGSMNVLVTPTAASMLLLPSGTVSGQTLASGSATATLTFLNGSTTTMSGSYSASTSALTLGGSSYAFTGTISAAGMTGTYSGPNGSGNFTGQAGSSSGVAARTYCGTYAAGSDYGWLNMVIAAGGTSASGLVVSLFNGATSTGWTGSVSGSTITGSTSSGIPIVGTLSVDGNSVTGTFVPTGSAAGNGTFQGSIGACPAAGATTIGGLWGTTIGLSTTIHFALTPSGSAVTGSGTLTVNFINNYTGDEFTITSGTTSGSNVTFPERSARTRRARADSTTARSHSRVPSREVR